MLGSVSTQQQKKIQYYGHSRAPITPSLSRMPFPNLRHVRRMRFTPEYSSFSHSRVLAYRALALACLTRIVSTRCQRSSLSLSCPLARPAAGLPVALATPSLVSSLSLVLVEMLKAHLVVMQRRSANLSAGKTEKGPRPGGAVKAPAFQVTSSTSSSQPHLNNDC